MFLSRNQILQGHALEVLKTIPSGTVQTCVTSVPYFQQRKYPIAPSLWVPDWAESWGPCEHEWFTPKNVEQLYDWNHETEPSLPGMLPREGSYCHGCNAWVGQLGQELQPHCHFQKCGACYLCHLVQVFREVKRVLRDDGTCWINIGDKVWEQQLLGLPGRLAIAMQSDGWFYQMENIWAKGVSFCPTYSGSCLARSTARRPSYTHEQVLLFSKSPNYFFDHESVREPAAVEGTRIMRSVWAIPAGKSRTSHTASFPSALPSVCIRAGTPEGGCCDACGTPYTRQIEMGESLKKLQRASGANRGGGYRGRSTKPYQMELAQDPAATKTRILRGMRARTTVAWVAGCVCVGASTRPSIVVDPFSGAGTTVRTAQKLGRDFIGIDASPVYVERTINALYDERGIENFRE